MQLSVICERELIYKSYNGEWIIFTEDLNLSIAELSNKCEHVDIGISKDLKSYG